MITVHTIGTQEMAAGAFLATLRSHNVDAVIDIRLHNEGKWYRFASGKHIRELCRANRMGYVHETCRASALATAATSGDHPSGRAKKKRASLQFI